MNQQEIKANMTQGTWVVTHDEHIQADSDIGYFIADCGFKNNNKDLSFKYNPHAITHAINNTYGRGINPKSVPDMFNVLNTICYYLHDIEEDKMYNIVKDILKNATL
jgi:hypothetical protein